MCKPYLTSWFYKVELGLNLSSNTFNTKICENLDLTGGNKMKKKIIICIEKLKLIKDCGEVGKKQIIPFSCSHINVLEKYIVGNMVLW